MDLGALISTLLGVVAGGVITWYMSRRYYLKSSKDLNKNVSILLKNNKLLTEYLEATLGTKEAAIIFDDKGKAFVLQKMASCPIRAAATLKADVAAIKCDEQ